MCFWNELSLLVILLILGKRRGQTNTIPLWFKKIERWKAEHLQFDPPVLVSQALPWDLLTFQLKWSTKQSKKHQPDQPLGFFVHLEVLFRRALLLVSKPTMKILTLDEGGEWGDFRLPYYSNKIETLVWCPVSTFENFCPQLLLRLNHAEAGSSRFTRASPDESLLILKGWAASKESYLNDIIVAYSNIVTILMRFGCLDVMSFCSRKKHLGANIGKIKSLHIANLVISHWLATVSKTSWLRLALFVFAGWIQCKSGFTWKLIKQQTNKQIKEVSVAVLITDSHLQSPM